MFDLQNYKRYTMDHTVPRKNEIQRTGSVKLDTFPLLAFTLKTLRLRHLSINNSLQLTATAWQ